MGEYAEAQLSHEITRGVRKIMFSAVPSWPKVPCPICGKPCGGKGDTARQGVHQHMKFKHGVRQKWLRQQMLDNHLITKEADDDR